MVRRCVPFRCARTHSRVKGTRRGVPKGFSRNALFWFQNKTLFFYTPHILSSPGKHRPLPFLTVNRVHLPLGERFTHFLFRRRSHGLFLTPVTISLHCVPLSYNARWKPTQAFANVNLENFGHKWFAFVDPLYILCIYLKSERLPRFPDGFVYESTATCIFECIVGP